MRCHEARARVWPPERPRLAEEDVVEAREHVRGCAACRAWLSQDRMLLDAFQRLAREEAPAGVRERVFDALARDRAGAPSSMGAGVGPTESPAGGPAPRAAYAVGGILAAAAVAAVLLVADGGWTATSQRPSGEVFVEDYLRRAVGEDHIRTDDPREVRRFLARELGLQVRPLVGKGLLLEGAEICLLEGRRGAMVIYKKDGVRVSHYLVPRRGAVPRGPSLLPGTVDGRRTMPVVTWSSGDVEEALVGEIPSDELLGLVRRGSS